MEEIGFKLCDKGDFKKWDGMTSWYLKYFENNKDFLQDGYIKRWHNALFKCFVPCNRFNN